MLRDPKKLILAVIRSFDNEDDGQEDRRSWSFAGDTARVTTSALLEMWKDYRLNGVLPQSGGWMDQPLALMVKIGAIDMIARTWEARNTKDFDWSRFSPDQRALITWAEAELMND